MATIRFPQSGDGQAVRIPRELCTEETEVIGRLEMFIR